MCAAPAKPALLRDDDEFRRALGLFYVNWATLDLTVDYAISQFLKVSAKQAHLITGGMMFGPKARALSERKESD